MAELQPSSQPAGRPTLDELVEKVLGSYQSDPRIQHIDASFLPSRDRAIDVLDRLRELVFPGFYGRQKLTNENIRAHVSDMIESLRVALERQVEDALRYSENLRDEGRGDACEQCATKAKEITDAFFMRLPEVRIILALDVEAAFAGDPAATNTDEAVFCYPGVYAVFVYRVAHELFKLGVPLLPRIWTEHAHGMVGIDIHPGATIGRSFFIDHGTGVVIGETAEIGSRVKLYQGVTIGAMSFAKDERGELIRGTKRHPTIEDDVVIYAGATILGGNTIVGKGSVIGANVFLTKSVPPGHRVTMKPPELKFRSADGNGMRGQ